MKLKLSPKFAGVDRNYLQFLSENCYEAWEDLLSFCVANTYALNLCLVHHISLGLVNVIACMLLLYRLRL